MKVNPEISALILIDFQGKLMPFIENGQEIVTQTKKISKIAKILNIPIVGTEQSPKSLGSNIAEISEFCDKTIIKEHFDACEDGLIAAIPTGKTQLIIAGCETHVCVMQTALHLIKENFDVFMLVDALGSRKTLDKEIGIQRLSQAGAKLITTEMAAFEWLDSAQNPAFKEVLKLIK